MITVNFENADKDLCVICGGYIEVTNTWICTECFKLCEDYSSMLEATDDKILTDTKSICCNANCRPIKRMTCGKSCHEEFIKYSEEKFGKVKKVVDLTTGITYKVPTIDIIENGLMWGDLPKYPIWTC